MAARLPTTLRNFVKGTGKLLGPAIGGLLTGHEIYELTTDPSLQEEQGPTIAYAISCNGEGVAWTMILLSIRLIQYRT